MIIAASYEYFLEIFESVKLKIAQWRADLKADWQADLMEYNAVEFTDNDKYVEAVTLANHGLYPCAYRSQIDYHFERVTSLI